MGISTIKYFSEILQNLSFILWVGGFIAILNILIMNRPSNNYSIFSFKVNLINRIEYLILLGIALFWSSILMHFLSTFNNPLKVKIYLLFLILAFSLTIFSLIQFVIGIKIFRIENKKKLYEKTDLADQLLSKQYVLFDSYFFLNLINLILALLIILINQT